MNLVCLALFPALALGATPAEKSKIAVVIIPMNASAEASAVKLEAFVVEALERFPSAAVKKPDDLFEVPPDGAARKSLAHADALVEEALAGKNLKAAQLERKLNEAMAAYDKGAAELRACRHLCDALALYAYSLNAHGDVEGAKSALLDLNALAPNFELDPRHSDRELAALRMQVVRGKLGQLRGSLTVTSRPSGARVSVNQQLLGYTPLTLPSLAVGKQVVQVDRPGFARYGELVDLSSDGASVAATLTATPGYKKYDALLDKVAVEALKDQAGPAMIALSKSLVVDRVMVGLIKQSGEVATEVALGLFDLHSGKKVAAKKATFQGDEYGQLKAEVGRLVNLVVSGEGSAPRSTQGDPLEGRAGTDDWNAEKGPTQEKPKKKTRDPLDGVSGTEDW